MRIIVYGAGALGSIIGGHLFRARHDTILVGNPRHVDKINESGLRLVTPEKTHILKIPACKDARELVPFDMNDVILLTAKSQHVLLCLGQLKRAGVSRTLPVFCHQNSICTEPLATRVFDRAYGAVVSMAGLFLEPGEVVDCVQGSKCFIEVGNYPRGVDDIANKVASIFRESGFAASVNDNIMKSKAAKCLVSLGHALLAITDNKGDLGPFIEEVRREAERVWYAAGIEWEDPGEFTKRTIVSSWQSLMRGTGNVESEDLNGDVVKLGRQVGIDTPCNEVLWRIAEEMATKGEKPGKYTAEELMMMIRKGNGSNPSDLNTGRN